MARTSRAGDLAALIALVLGAAHAAVSLVWVFGGELGLALLGGALADLVREGHPLTRLGLVLVVVAKAVAAALALAFTSGRRPAPRWTVWAGYGVGGLLACYGGALTIGGALVATGVIQASQDADWTAIYGHLFLWDPWFLCWGLALLVAVRCRPRTAPDDRVDRHR